MDEAKPKQKYCKLTLEGWPMLESLYNSIMCLFKKIVFCRIRCMQILFPAFEHNLMVLQVRANIQRALGRPLPLEEIGTMTVGGLKGLASSVNPGQIGSQPAAPASSAKTQTQSQESAEKPESNEPQSSAQEVKSDKKPLLTDIKVLTLCSLCI